MILTTLYISVNQLYMISNLSILVLIKFLSVVNRFKNTKSEKNRLQMIDTFCMLWNFFFFTIYNSLQTFTYINKNIVFL